MHDNDLKDRYESLRYDTIPFVQTHPVHLATMAQLHGMQPVDPRRCRYLEIGCGDGLNIIGMACQYPESFFVGIDLADTTIQQGLAMVEQLQLKNVQLISGDILQFPLATHPFDYIVAHGFYCWVPEAVQEHLWVICQQLLSPQGIVYISYNTYPGCYLRRMMREMMLFHTRAETEPAAKVYQAKAFLQFLDQAQAIHGEVVTTIRHEIDQLLHQRQDFSIYHDDLAGINMPVYFHQFVSAAAQYGFQFLSEADYYEMCYNHFPDSVQTHLHHMEEHDFLTKEQYLDFLKLRRFRETLLCRKHSTVDRNSMLHRLREQLFTSRIKVEGEFSLDPEVVITFVQDKGARIGVNHALSKLAMQMIGSSFPRHWSWQELLEAAMPRLAEAGCPPLNSQDEDLLANTLLSAYSVGMVELHCLAPAMADHVPERPRTSPLAALQLRSGNRLISNLMHLPVHIENDFVAGFLQLCDGSRSHDELVRDCAPLAGASDVPLSQRVEHALGQAIQLALFVPSAH